MKTKKGLWRTCKKSTWAVELSVLAILVLFGGCKSSPPGVKGLFAGVSNVFIIADDNSLWSAGYNRSGQLGLETDGEPGIVQVMQDGAALKGVKYVAAGENHTVILRDDGSLWAAGESLYGELGLGGDGTAKLTGLTRLDMTGVKAVAAGNNSTFVIKDDGTLWAAGYNYYGELGLGDRENRAVFTQVTGAGRDVKAVSAGARHTVILKNDGTVWTAGYNYNGQLGHSNYEDSADFTQVSSISGAAAVAAGNYHTAVLKSDGTVWTAGENYYGQLGWDDEADRSQFTQVGDDKGQNISNAKEIAARGNLTLILRNGNALLLAGSYKDPRPRDENNLPPEQTRSGDARSTFSPLEVENASDLKDIKQIGLGNQSVYVITGSNELWAAGSNRYGQLNLDYDTEDLSSLRKIYP